MKVTSPLAIFCPLLLLRNAFSQCEGTGGVGILNGHEARGFGPCSVENGPARLVWMTAGSLSDDEYYIQFMRYKNQEILYEAGEFSSTQSKYSPALDFDATEGDELSASFRCHLELGDRRGLGLFDWVEDTVGNVVQNIEDAVSIGNCDGADFEFKIIDCGCPEGSLVIKDCVYNRGPDDAKDAECERIDDHCNSGRRAKEAESEFEEGNTRRLVTVADFTGIGCFPRHNSPEEHTVEASTTSTEQAEKCDSVCLTNYFGFSMSTCYCYVNRPENRISIGSCIPVCVELGQTMEVYFKANFDDTCNQETTSSIINFLAEEDDAPFGFDIVTNKFLPSPFELFKDECGTNIYEVQTEFTQDSNQLSTTVSGIKEFALKSRSHLSQSISTSASASYSSLSVEAAVKVSGSADKEQTNMFQSSGADRAGGRVFTSVGVKRLAVVEIVDFDNKESFVTFNSQFRTLLKKYQESVYDRTVAKEIFQKYGMFIVTRGIFGGFIQLRSTMSESSVSRLFDSAEHSRKCYEASVSGKASAYGFSGSFEANAGQCSEEAEREMLSNQNAYLTESSEETVVGGKQEGNDFIVIPETSTLLTSQDQYPLGDDGIKLRRLSDFLSTKAISPLEVKRAQISEAGFAKIQINLQNHIDDELLELESLLDGCGECEVPYLVYAGSSQNEYTCSCYDPPVATANAGALVEAKEDILVDSDSDPSNKAAAGLNSIFPVIGILLTVAVSLK